MPLFKFMETEDTLFSHSYKDKQFLSFLMLIFYMPIFIVDLKKFYEKRSRALS